MPFSCCCSSSPPQTEPSSAQNDTKSSVIYTQPTSTAIWISTQKNILTLLDNPPSKDDTNLDSISNLDSINEKIKTCSLESPDSTSHAQFFEYIQLRIDNEKSKVPPDYSKVYEYQLTSVQALIRHTLRYKDALTLIDPVLEYYMKEKGPRNSSTLLTQFLKAHALLLDRRHKEALESFKNIRELTMNQKKSKSETEFPPVIQRMNKWCLRGISMCLFLAGDYEAAMKTTKEFYNDCLKLCGPHSIEVISAQFDMAKILKKQGKLKEAMAGTIKVYRDMHNCDPKIQDDMDVLLPGIHFLGTLLRDQGNPKVAYEILMEILGDEVRILGQEDHLTVATLYNFGILFERCGRKDLASILFKDVFEGRRKIFGEDHPKTLKAKRKLDGMAGNLTEMEY